MKAVIQRVTKANVTVSQNIIGEIKQGLVILVGIVDEDTDEDINWLINKICNLRIFNNADDVMNNSLLDINGEVLIISQFTLHASTKKGNRPSYIKAAKPDIAKPIYNQFLKAFEIKLNAPIKSGEFGADMKIELINDGPVTIIIDTKNKT